MPASQDDNSTTKRSPWRRALNKLTPSRKNASPDGNIKKSRRIFSSPTKKMKKRSKKKAARKRGSSQESNQVVMVQILPKSPMRYEDSSVASCTENIRVARLEPESPPRILKPSDISFETEIIFNEIFQAYIRKFHNHGGSSENTEGCTLCSKGKEIMTPMVISVEKEQLTSATITVATSRDDDSMSILSSALSELTIPVSIRRPLSAGHFFNRFTTSVSMSSSKAADALICPCATMPPPREQEEDLYQYGDNTDDDGVEYDDDDESSGDESSRTSCSENDTNSQDETCETSPSVKLKSK